jgi:hypothetical protein
MRYAPSFNVIGTLSCRTQTAVPNVTAMPKPTYGDVILASNQPTQEREWTAEEILAREG